MGNLITTGLFRQNTDAQFREWVQNVSAGLDTVGLPKTVDTGQIDLNTVLRPNAANQVRGYEIRRFDDSLQSVAPIFLKIEYGSGSNLIRPLTWLTVGSGSDGAGNITGTIYCARVAASINNHIPANEGNEYPSYFVAIEGFAALFFGGGRISGNTATGGFTICRSVGNDGQPTPEGVTIYVGDSEPLLAQASRIGEGSLSGRIQEYSLIAMLPANSLVGGSAQVYKHYTITPRMRVNPYMLSYFLSEIGAGATFDKAIVGAKERRYIALARNEAGGSPRHLGSTGIAIAWEDL